MASGKASGKVSYEVWCQRELTRLLKFQVGDDVVQYLFSIETRKDVEEFLEEMLGTKNRAVENFQREFFRRWRPPLRQPEAPTSEQAELLKPLVRAKDEEMVLFTPKNEKSEEKTRAIPPPGFSKSGTSPEAQGDKDTSTVGQGGLHSSNVSLKVDQIGKTGQAGITGRQKQKFVPLMSVEGQSRATVLLPGRHTCQCLGQKHALISNCIECGRIVCSQEGSGPCAFCGALVCTPEEEEILMRNSKKGLKFRDKFLKQFMIKEGEKALEHLQKSSVESVGLSEAMEHKDKLLTFDQTSAKRTKVIDDEMDYFSVDSNRWLSHEDRELLRAKELSLRAKRHESRRNKPVTIDFAGRKVVEEEESTDVYDERHALEALQSSKGRKKDPTDIIHTHAGGLYNPSIPIDPPKYQETHKERRKAKRQSSQKSEEETTTLAPGRSSIVRLQDRTLQEMTDEGKCLSMHQPWASLLVAGIKTCEGRTWYSTHRGRLWIAAAAKKPDPQEVDRLEQFYRAYHKEETLMFPMEYPTGCLLGCVDMVDCLPQEEYRDQFPEGESESSYVFVVENPRELMVKFPVKGDHKIWRLDPTTHAGAKKGLKPSVNS